MINIKYHSNKYTPNHQTNIADRRASETGENIFYFCVFPARTDREQKRLHPTTLNVNYLHYNSFVYINSIMSIGVCILVLVASMPRLIPLVVVVVL